VRRSAAALAILLLLALVGGALYLRADKRHVFREVAGELAAGRVLESVATSGGVARLVELVNDRGDAVATVWVRRPRALDPDYRIVLVYSGENTGRRILDLIPERDDLVLAAPQYPYREPRGVVGKLRWPAAIRRAAFRTVAAGLLTVSWLEREEALDPARLLVIGASLGSSFGVLHTAIDPRVPRLLVVHGGGDLPLVIRAIETRRGRPWRGRAAAALAAVLVDTFDPLHYVAEIAPREIVIIGARDDRQFRPRAPWRSTSGRASPSSSAGRAAPTCARERTRRWTTCWRRSTGFSPRSRPERKPAARMQAAQRRQGTALLQREVSPAPNPSENRSWDS
jgi:hypothetical protein